MKTEQVLKLIDGGCDKHPSLELTLFGPEAELMENICQNLLRDGDCHTFVCKEGRTHRIRMRVAFPAKHRMVQEFRDFLRRLD